MNRSIIYIVIQIFFKSIFMLAPNIDTSKNDAVQKLLHETFRQKIFKKCIPILHTVSLFFKYNVYMICIVKKSQNAAH